MCGIAGRFSVDSNKEENMDIVKKMKDAQKHRGLDECGLWYDSKVAFAHNRLSILDVENGKQPMKSMNEKYILVFNGEIYNYAELKQILIDKGHIFRTNNSDTEVILNGYIEWKEEVFEKLNGMFSVAIYDLDKQEIIMARDRVGIKPLYYYLEKGVFSFASEIKAILVDENVKKEIDNKSIVEYFQFRATLGTNTIIKDIKRLEPGTYLKYSLINNDLFVEKYTKKKIVLREKNYNKMIDELDSLMRNSIRMHMISDVPVGLFLSGGIDSSMIAKYAKEFNSDIEAFTLKTNSKYDESSYAEKVANQYDIKLNIVEVTGNDFLGVLDEWIYSNDDITADPSALSLILLSKAARKKGIKVMLAGEGADELFGGYSTYNSFVKISKLSRINPIGRKCIKHIGGILFKGSKREYCIRINNAKYLGTPAGIHSDMLEKLFKVKYSTRFDELDYINCEDKGKEAMLNERGNGLVNVLLNRSDRSTMSQCLEARVPFLENQIIDFADGLSDMEFFSENYVYNKKILKDLARRYFGPDIIDRKKSGFAIPLEEWINNDFKRLIDEFIEVEMIENLNYRYIKDCVIKHKSKPDFLHTSFLWSWIILEKWYRMFWITK